MINKTGVIGRRFAGFYRSAQIRTANFVNQHSSLISLALFNLPLAIAGWQVLSTVKIMAVKGICWEQELKIDVAQAARQKILKDLTRLDEFGDIIAEVEPAIQDAISRAMAEINRLESRARFNRDAMTKQQDKLIEIIEKDVWQTLEPKIKDARKKERIKAWIDNMKAQLEGVDRVQETAAHVLREEVRTILYNFNEKAEDQLGQQIPGEIEGIE